MLLGLALAWAGCSVERDYKILSFFFDGVPDPSLVKTNADAVRFAKETGGKVYTHNPYANNKCGECHTNLAGEQAREVNAEVCLRCHTAVTNEYAKMHGAVAAGACIYCHTPHESTIEHLLRSNSPDLCTQCHAVATFGNPPSGPHADMKRRCLDCHYGHGGPERYFLRPGWDGTGTAAPPTPTPTPIPTPIYGEERQSVVGPTPSPPPESPPGA